MMHGRVVIQEGSVRRRRWTAKEKDRISTSMLAPGVKFSDAAREHHLSLKHLFPKRRDAKAGKLAFPVDDDSLFARILTEEPQRQFFREIPIGIAALLCGRTGLRSLNWRPW